MPHHLVGERIDAVDQVVIDPVPREITEILRGVDRLPVLGEPLRTGDWNERHQFFSFVSASAKRMARFPRRSTFAVVPSGSAYTHLGIAYDDGARFATAEGYFEVGVLGRVTSSLAELRQLGDAMRSAGARSFTLTSTRNSA